MDKLEHKTAIIIPIRMSSTRLPGKFHAMIDNKPMILHIIDRAREANFSNIFVACDHPEHLKLVEAYGIKAIMTSPDHQSGSDRVYEALEIIDPEAKFEYIVNLQGDIPFVKPKTLHNVVQELDQDPEADISTMLVPFSDHADLHNPNYVKAIFDSKHHAIYFSRSPIPFSMNNNEEIIYYHHIGIYVYRRKSLGKYIQLAPSKLEMIEKLEQLRALENGMKIRIGITDDKPISVDIPADLEKARAYASTLRI